MKKLTWIIVSIITVGIMIAGVSSYASRVNNDLAKSVIRLHVIANSNSTEDQDLKYKVRDNILNYMKKEYGTNENGFRNLEVNQQLLSKLETLANQTIGETGKSYLAETKFGTFSFPTKTYGDLSFPAGYYKAVRVVIGEGTGKNWWCVMFPPLCMINSTTGKLTDDSKEMLKERVGDEDYKLLSESSEGADVKVKFKVVEWFQSIKMGVEDLFDGNKE